MGKKNVLSAYTMWSRSDDDVKCSLCRQPVGWSNAIQVDYTGTDFCVRLCWKCYKVHLDHLEKDPLAFGQTPMRMVRRAPPPPAEPPPAKAPEPVASSVEQQKLF